MKVWFLICVYVTCFSRFGFAQDNLEVKIGEMSKRVIEQLSRSSLTKVAVADFETLDADITGLGKFLAEEFSVALSGNESKIEVIDRSRFRDLLEENKMNREGWINPEKSAKLGRLIGIEMLVTGVKVPFGDNVRVTIKVIRLGTGTVVTSCSDKIAKTSAVELLLSKDIAVESNLDDQKDSYLFSDCESKNTGVLTLNNRTNHLIDVTVSFGNNRTASYAEYKIPFNGNRSKSVLQGLYTVRFQLRDKSNKLLNGIEQVSINKCKSYTLVFDANFLKRHGIVLD